MLAKSSEKANARTLRRQGLSYREILQKVNVAKSSISLWCRDIQLTPRQRQLLEEKKRSGLEKGRETISKVKPERKSKFDVKVPEIRRLYWEEEYSAPQIAQILGVKEYLIYWLMRRHNIPRRNYTQSSYVVNKSKPQFKVKKKLSPEEENLRIAGIMLYWAEGSKKGKEVSFANSDPQMIKIFLKFLRQICGVGESRLRIHVYAYSYQNIDEVKEYWHKVTKVPLAQFPKPYVRKGNPNLSGRKLPYGLIQIRYNDKRLLELIMTWVKDYVKKVN